MIFSDERESRYQIYTLSHTNISINKACRYDLTLHDEEKEQELIIGIKLKSNERKRRSEIFHLVLNKILREYPNILSNE